MNAPDRHDFFAEPDLPRPQVGSGAAEAVAREHFGAVGRFREVGSQQDRNFVIDGPAGRFVLKIANPAFSDAELAAQDHALLHLAAAAPDLVIPRPHPARDGGFVARFESGGVALRARLLSFVPGGPLADAAYLAPAVMARLGDLAARVASGLADCRHPGLDRTLQWDIRNTRRVHETLAGHVTDPDRAAILRRAVEDSCDRLDALSPQLRVQPVHGDITDDNVVCEPGRDGRPVPSGVIDFGDVGLGWTVAELATACASLLHHTPTRPLAVLAAVRAFHAVLPLTGSELAALWPAITARTAALVVSGLHQGRIDPGNAYVLRAQEQEWRAFEAALSLPPDVAHAAIRAALGLPVPHGPGPGRPRAPAPGPRRRGPGRGPRPVPAQPGPLRRRLAGPGHRSPPRRRPPGRRDCPLRRGPADPDPPPQHGRARHDRPRRRGVLRPRQRGDGPLRGSRAPRGDRPGPGGPRRRPAPHGSAYATGPRTPGPRRRSG